MLNFILFISGIAGLIYADYLSMKPINKFGVAEFDSYLHYVGFLIKFVGLRLISWLLIALSICWTIVNSIREITL